MVNQRAQAGFWTCDPVRRQRRGVTSMLAMIYLILCSSLALGFYYSISTAIAVGDNSSAISHARLAAESGMEIIRVPLSRLVIPPSADAKNIIDVVHAQLADMLEATENLKGREIKLVGKTIHIPAGEDQFIALDNSGSRFRVEIKQLGGSTDLSVRVLGRSSRSNVTRTVSMTFQEREHSSSILQYGIVSRAPISMDSNAFVTGMPTPAAGDMLIVTNVKPALTMKANTTVSGDVNLSDPNGTVSVASPTMIKGEIIKGVTVPEFPTVDTSAFKPYATNRISGNSPTITTPILKNLYIRANTNPKFAGTLIQGVIYIETPNKVTFDHNLTIQGVIVQQNDGTGDTTANQITFNSNTTLTGVETLPALPEFPKELREMTGSMILAPNFMVHFESNFGVSGGTIVAGKIDMDSNTNGVIKGSVICMGTESFHLDSNSAITISNENTRTPAGLFFSSHYVALPGSYSE